MIESGKYFLIKSNSSYISGALYTGLANGKIVSVRGKVITEIGYTGHMHCSSEETCGRPLGVRIHNGSLYVVNAYKGKIYAESSIDTFSIVRSKLNSISKILCLKI